MEELELEEEEEVELEVEEVAGLEDSDHQAPLVLQRRRHHSLTPLPRCLRPCCGTRC